MSKTITIWRAKTFFN